MCAFRWQLRLRNSPLPFPQNSQVAADARSRQGKVVKFAPAEELPALKVRHAIVPASQRPPSALQKPQQRRPRDVSQGSPELFQRPLAVVNEDFDHRTDLIGVVVVIWGVAVRVLQRRRRPPGEHDRPGDLFQKLGPLLEAFARDRTQVDVRFGVVQRLLHVPLAQCRDLAGVFFNLDFC